MGAFLPTNKVADERVLHSFYRTMAREAERQRFLPEVFPVIGDLTLGELMNELRGGEIPAGMQRHYERIIFFSGFSLPKDIVYLKEGAVDRRVIESYKDWLKSIGEERADIKLHRTTIRELERQQQENAEKWRRADELSRKFRPDLSGEEQAELQSLESTLDGNSYSQLRADIRLRLVADEIKKAEAKYKVPGTEISFAEALAEIELGSPRGFGLYKQLVFIHAGFEFEKTKTCA